MKEMTTKFKSQMRLQQEPVQEFSKIVELLEKVNDDKDGVLNEPEKSEYFFKDLIAGLTQTLAQFIKLNL